MTDRSVFEPGLIHRLKAQNPGVDVEKIASDVIRRIDNPLPGQEPVKKPGGLLIAWVRSAKAKLGDGPQETNVSYARFRAGIIGRILAESLKPKDVAALLRAGQLSNQYGHLITDAEVDYLSGLEAWQ